MRLLDHPRWPAAWRTLRRLGGRLDLPGEADRDPCPERALSILQRHPERVRPIGPDWRTDATPTLLAFPGLLLLLERGGRAPLSSVSSRRIGPGDGTLQDVPGAAALLREIYRTHRLDNGHALLRPLASAHERAKAALRHGTAAADRIQDLARLPNGPYDGPLLYRTGRVVLVEAAAPCPRKGPDVHYLADALPV